jgi:uncharacterized membrane protein YciS (DUF1049 family)
MKKEEAEKALAMIRQVISRTRDDTVLENWGLVWILHGITNAIAFGGTNVLTLRGTTSVPTYFALWGVILVVNLGLIFFLRKPTGGAITFVEKQIWATWMTFVAASFLVAAVNHLMGQPAFRLGPVLAVLSAIGFATMGHLMSRVFYWFAGLHAATAIAMAAAPRYQFFALGAAWFVSLVVPGVKLHRDRLSRGKRGAEIL